VDFTAFVLSNLPPPPARVLEVGCGRGELALALDAAGYDVLAIDPEAPAGEIFRQITLEELDDPRPFDAAIGGRVFHHVDPLEPAVEKLARLAPLLIVEEFVWDRMDVETAQWYESRRQALRAAGHPPERLEDPWREAHEHLHGCATLREAFDRGFLERYFEWRPYLYRYAGDDGTEALELSLIESGAIRALAFRYVGIRRGPA
jgi:SAM-dependent methyltransferase